jgi:hypothetical protein
MKLLLSAITTVLLLVGQCWAQTATTKQASSAPSETKGKGTGKKAETAKRQEHGPTAGAAAPKKQGGTKTTQPTGGPSQPGQTQFTSPNRREPWLCRRARSTRSPRSEDNNR